MNGDQVEHYALRRDGSVVSYREAIQCWQDDERFRSFISSLLTGASFNAFRWETPPVNLSTADRPFEFVLLNAPGLDQMPEPLPFSEQFAKAGKSSSVITFENLSGDAVLVVPCPERRGSVYAHLGSFVRNASSAQVHFLWKAVGAAMASRLDGGTPVWLSTAGMGVAWLHVRLDSRPKYYGFAAYRKLA